MALDVESCDEKRCKRETLPGTNERTEKIENFATFLNTKSFVTVVTIFVMEHNLNISGANI